jgi:nucleobase:cation symporter-1, NCS1 family
MGPLAGVIISDYYLIKKRKLNIHEVYRDHGIYHYSHGWNWRAYAAFCCGFGPLIPGFAKSIKNDLNVGGAWKIYTFAWIFGFTISLSTYYVIVKYVSGLGDAIVDVAVYPPQKSEGASDEESGSGEIYEEKSVVDIKTKEVESPL